MNTTPLATGTYTFMHPYNYVSLSYVVSGELAQVYSVPTRHNPASLLGTVNLLEAAQTLSAARDVRFTPATIGKTRAAKLHRILGRVGLCNSDHYGNARRALGREVFSLATLTEAEASTFWKYLRRTFPAVQQAAY